MINELNRRSFLHGIVRGLAGAFVGEVCSSEARADVYWDTRTNSPVAIDVIGRDGELGPYRGRIPSHWRRVSERELEILMKRHSSGSKKQVYECKLEIIDDCDWLDIDKDRWPDRIEYTASKEVKVNPGEKNNKGHIRLWTSGYEGGFYQLGVEFPNKSKIHKLKKITKIKGKHYGNRTSLNFSKLYELGGEGVHTFYAYIDGEITAHARVRLINEEKDTGGVILMD